MANTGMARTWRLGLTGGIGSGKSTVAALLQSCGASIIDSDQISRETTAPGGGAIDAIRDAFGEMFIQADGSLDRARMRALAFREPEARQRLEDIIHPLVSHISASRAAQAQAQGCPLLVFDVPLLVESGRWAHRLDAVLVVDCPPDIQISRVCERSGLDPQAVQAIMASQAQPAQRRASADMVIDNGGSTSLADLKAHVQQAAQWFGL